MMLTRWIISASLRTENDPNRAFYSHAENRYVFLNITSQFIEPKYLNQSN